MAPRRRGAMGECERRTQEARIAALFARPRTHYRAVQGALAAGASFFSGLPAGCAEDAGPTGALGAPRLVQHTSDHVPLVDRRPDVTGREAVPGQIDFARQALQLVLHLAVRLGSRGDHHRIDLEGSASARRGR